MWTSAHGEHLFVCLIRNEFAMVNMIHQNVSFTACRVNNSISISTRHSR